MRSLRELAEAMRCAGAFSDAEEIRIAGVLDEAQELANLADDPRVSAELIGIRIKNGCLRGLSDIELPSEDR